MFKRYKVPFIKGSFVLLADIMPENPQAHPLGLWADWWEMPGEKDKWLQNLDSGMDTLEQAEFPRDIKVHLFYGLTSLGIEKFDWGTEKIPVMRNLEGAYDKNSYTLFMRDRNSIRLRITLRFERATVPFGNFIAEIM